MRFGIVGSIEGWCCPAFLTKEGKWSGQLQDMETFTTVKEACEAAMNCCNDTILGVSIEFSGFIRDRYQNLQ